MRLFLKNLLFTVVVPGTVAGWLPWWLAGDAAARGLGAWLSATPLLLVGIAIYLWCLWDFAGFGQGTPAPIDAPVKLVVRGLYHYSRNPMYVGVLSAILGQALLWRAPGLLLYAACVATAFHLFVVRYEEPHLAELFGEDYGAYRARVGRWLPRIRPG